MQLLPKVVNALRLKSGALRVQSLPAWAKYNRRIMSAK